MFHVHSGTSSGTVRSVCTNVHQVKAAISGLVDRQAKVPTERGICPGRARGGRGSPGIAPRERLGAIRGHGIRGQIYFSTTPGEGGIGARPRSIEFNALHDNFSKRRSRRVRLPTDGTTGRIRYHGHEMSKVAPPEAKPARRVRRKGAGIALSTRRRRSKAEDRLDGDAATKALRESAERIPYQKARRDLDL